MKLICTVLFSVCIATGLWAQTPDKVNYQAVARDASGDLLTTQSINVNFLVRSGSASGPVVYEESHAGTMTNAYGLFNLVVGDGTPTTGTMSGIDWANDNYFLEVEIDGASVGAQQLVAVPYALMAKEVEKDSVNDDDADPTNELQTLSLSGNDVSLSNGGGTVSIDGDPSNELQTLSLSGNDLSLSSGGGTVTLPMNSLWNDSNGHAYRLMNNVGIGTATPLRPLHVRAGTGANTASSFALSSIVVEGNNAYTTMNGASYGGYTFANSSNYIVAGLFLDNTRDKLMFKMGGSDYRAQMLPSGDMMVGGFASASPETKFHVYDTEEADGSYGMGVMTLGTASGALIFDTDEITSRNSGGVRPIMLNPNGGGISINEEASDTTHRVYVTAEGHLGLGTSVPASDLHINQTSVTIEGAGISITNALIGGMPTWNTYVTGNSDYAFAFKGTFKGKILESNGAFVQASDARLKNDIRPLPATLDRLVQLQPRSYYYNDDQKREERSVGVIAQELQQLFPEAVVMGEDGHYGVIYDNLAVYSVQAIGELKAIVDVQQELIAALQAQLDAITQD